MSARGKLLYNRVRVGEYVSVGVREGWRDLAWEGTELDQSGASRSIEGRVCAVSAHRVSVSRADDPTHLHVIRRVDVEAIECWLGR